MGKKGQATCSALKSSSEYFQHLSYDRFICVYPENEMNPNNSSIVKWQNPWLTDNITNMDALYFILCKIM